MSSPAYGLTTNPPGDTLRDANDRGSVQWAFETGGVTAAANLTHELQRATTPAVLAAQSSFFASVSHQLTKADKPNLYTAMTRAASDFGALGDADSESFPTLYHAAGANSFYLYNVSTAWKKYTAFTHGLDPDNSGNYQTVGSPVYLIWADEVGNSAAPINPHSLTATSVANRANSWGWWSPSERLALPSSGSRDKGDQDYFTICQIVSLAPDWYPWGLVGFIYPSATGAQLKRPEPYDGANPLWVQRPADHPARTGGGAREMLLGTAVSVTQVGPISAWIPTVESIEALQTAPVVNDYADNLLIAWNNAQTEPEKRVASWQTTVVEQCRASRAQANLAFNRQAAGESDGADCDE
jgi:hypothetical protein